MAERNPNLRAELERKRILLAQKKEAARKRYDRYLQDENTNPDGQGSQDQPRLGGADDILRELGLSPALSRASTAPSNVSSMELNRSHMNNISGAAPSPDVSSSVSQQQQCSTSLNVESLTPKPAVPLEVVHVNQINIVPQEKVVYTKSTQTPAPISDSISADVPVEPNNKYYGKQAINVNNPPARLSDNGQRTPNDSLSHGTQMTGVNQLANLEWDDEFPVLTEPYEEDEQSSDFNNISTGRQSKLTTANVGPQAEHPAKNHDDSSGQATQTESQVEIKEMSEEQRRQIELREDYQLFVDRATKVLERALYQNESPEIFVQYFPDDGKDAADSDRRRGNKLSLNRIFMDEKWSKFRCVTGFDWSAQYPELLVASYYTNEQAPSDPDGTLLVWNTKFKNTSPEYVFHCQSPIMSCCFAKFHPNLIVGGTYSGQIVLWDMRAHKKTPVQRSPLTAAAHTYPVYCAKVVGTQNAHNLISISTDGKLCSWSLDMLSSPQETLELNQQKQTRSVAVTCMSFHPNDYNNFLVGSEEGTLYSACRHGSKTGILTSFEGHQGLVTNVDYRPGETQAGYSHLFLTSSIDWTVKLWDSKEAEPIHSFESNGDYIYDVKWSPNNPALFATADGDGRVDIWNLANDSELPTASTHVEPLVTSGSKTTHPSLNKLIWTPSGNQIVAGDDVGRIHVYDIGDAGEMSSSRMQEDKWKLGEHIS